jgi:hypothetical protein
MVQKFEKKKKNYFGQMKELRIAKKEKGVFLFLSFSIIYFYQLFEINYLKFRIKNFFLSLFLLTSKSK